MKRSLARVSVIALALGWLAAVGTSACADAEGTPFTPPPVDTGESPLPDTAPESDVDAGPAPDASIEAGPKRCSDHGLCPTGLPAGQTLLSVWGDGTGVAWAVSAEGNILRWDGTTWTIHVSGLGPLATVWGSGPTDVWVGGEGGLYHGTGASSAALAFAASLLPAPSLPIASIWGLSADDVWAVGTMYDPDTGESFGRAFHFSGDSDPAGGWAAIPISPELVACSHVWGSAGSGVWIAGSRPIPEASYYTELAVFRKSGGDDFTEVTLPVEPGGYPLFMKPASLNGAVAVADSSIWLHGRTVGSSPTLWRGTSTDNGETFTFTSAPDGLPNGPQVNALFGTAANDVWTAGEYGQVRHWNGTTWTGKAVTITNLPVIDPFYAIWARGSSEVWLVGKDLALRYDPAHKKDGGVQ